jgi:hypothetical protein
MHSSVVIMLALPVIWLPKVLEPTASVQQPTYDHEGVVDVELAAELVLVDVKLEDCELLDCEEVDVVWAIEMVVPEEEPEEVWEFASTPVLWEDIEVVVELTVELELVVKSGFGTVLLYPYISRWSAPPHSSKLNVSPEARLS